MSVALSVSHVSVAGRLAPVSFEVSGGSVHAIVGPNGAGKSTLVACVLGDLKHQGRIEVLRSPVAVVPQTVEMPSWPLSVEELVALAVATKPVFWGLSDVVRAEVRQALERFDAAPFAKQPIGTLSGGALKRVLLAAAFIRRPRLLLLDEPEAGLDVQSVRRFERLVGELKNDGIAVVWVTHDEARRSALATHVTRLEPVT